MGGNALAWAQKMDPSAGKRGVINPKANATLNIFKEQGIRAGATHGLKRIAGTTAKSALVTAGVITGAAVFDPVGLAVGVNAVAAGAGHKAYRAARDKGALNKSAQASVVSAYAAHQKAEKDAAKSESKKDEKGDPATDAIHQMQDALAGILHSISKETARTANAVENQEL